MGAVLPPERRPLRFEEMVLVCRRSGGTRMWTSASGFSPCQGCLARERRRRRRCDPWLRRERIRQVVDIADLRGGPGEGGAGLEKRAMMRSGVGRFLCSRAARAGEKSGAAWRSSDPNRSASPATAQPAGYARDGEKNGTYPSGTSMPDRWARIESTLGIETALAKYSFRESDSLQPRAISSSGFIPVTRRRRTLPS